MADEEKKNPEQANPGKSDQEYLDIIESMRDNTVSKDDYEKLQAEKSELLKRLARGQFDPKKEQEKSVDLSALRKKIFSQNTNNLEFCKSAVELRDELLKQSDGKTDIFMPNGRDYVFSNDDKVAADAVADVIKECIADCGGSSEVFTAMLNSRMVDPSPFMRFKK